LGLQSVADEWLSILCHLHGLDDESRLLAPDGLLPSERRST
jgi:hypothetical protein